MWGEGDETRQVKGKPPAGQDGKDTEVRYAALSTWGCV